MNFEEKWIKLNQLGQPGGQGAVYRVINKSQYESIRSDMSYAILNLIHNASISSKENKLFFNLLFTNIVKVIDIQNPENQGALKVLHKPENARDFGSQKDRIKEEIRAMRECKHKHLLKIIDCDTDDYWYVSEYHPNGTLAEKKDLYRNKPLSALKALRPIIEGTAELHKKRIIHRDIKPQNIFFNTYNEMILGDFGLVFKENNSERISNTFSNVGSRDWQPGWTQGKKIDEVNPTIDVFSIGKVLWSIISGDQILTLWYFNENGNNLVQRFPENKFEMNIINSLLEKCVVERERDCIPNASELLGELDSTIEKIESKMVDLNLEEVRKCSVCRRGNYVEHSRDKQYDHNYGLTVQSESYYLIFICNNCGNTQLFFCNGGEIPTGWR